VLTHAHLLHFVLLLLLLHCTGWRTKDTKATGVDTCLAPPGFELKDGATNITECEANTYKVCRACLA
jgi:hypothetical protein